ncbi:MAG: flagellar basal body-associated FliL family protein [Humidesulfovibrio sp.]|nr:flagellar basal body-associated FliL family protein [Humidesulfovibrio sp.]
MADQTDATGETSANGAKQSDVLIDTSEPTRGTQKVELDLEDAPFLEEEEEVKPAPAPMEAVGLEDDTEKKPSGLDRKKKLIIIGAAALVGIIVAAVAVKMLLFKGKTATAPEPTKHAAPKEATSSAKEAKPAPAEIQVRLEPFLVEQKGEGDQIRFLTVRLLLTTTTPSVAKEIELKHLAVRNAIFYYLKNKDVQFLADEHNADNLKSELLLVINQYATDGKFDNLLFEEYVVK